MVFWHPFWSASSYAKTRTRSLRNGLLGPFLRLFLGAFRVPCPTPGLVILLRSQMELLKAILPYAEITLSLLLILGIVLQQRGANLGGAFGGDNFASTFYKRRGAEKFLFNATSVVAILFVISAVLGFLL